MNFLDAIAEPLADLLRAVADWLDGEPVELPTPTPEVKPQWVSDGRGGFKPSEE